MMSDNKANLGLINECNKLRQENEQLKKELQEFKSDAMETIRQNNIELDNCYQIGKRNYQEFQKYKAMWQKLKDRTRQFCIINKFAKATLEEMEKLEQENTN